jgi:energy-converting hydrogenase Eha subunit F
MTPWISTVGVLGVRGVLILAEKQNNFHVRIGIQTAASDIEVADTALNPTDTGGTGLGYVGTVIKQYFSFDPTISTAGNITTKAYFRVGLLYSSTDATIGRGDCILRVGYRT